MFVLKIIIIFLPINFNVCFGCPKEPSHWDQWFYFACFTAEYRLLPNPKKACIFPILENFSQPEDFIGIYSEIQKAKAVSKKDNKSTGDDPSHWDGLSHWDGSFEYLQHMFSLRNKKINFQLRTLIWRPIFFFNPLSANRNKSRFAFLICWNV